MADRLRQLFRALFKGLNTRNPADLEPQGKYPLAINVRADGDGKIRTRPGYDQSFTTGGEPITDLGSYATLGTDSKPRILAHDRSGRVYLDDEEQKGTVGAGGPGASIIPFRPSASPQSWAYIANSTGYEKFSAPDADNHVLQQKVGIAEPQAMPEASPEGFYFTDFSGTVADWAGDAHWTTDPVTGKAYHVDANNDPVPGGDVNDLCQATRITDNVIAAIPDPANAPDSEKWRYSLQMGPNDLTPPDPCSGNNVGKPVEFAIGEILHFDTPTGVGTVEAVVEDVYPAIQVGNGIVIQAIYYFSGQTGKCVIVPSQLGFGNVSVMPNVATNAPPSAILPDFAGALGILRRGSLITLDSEVCFIESVTIGPTGSLTIETSTVGTHTVGESVNGALAICCSFLKPFDPVVSLPGRLARSYQINFVMLKGGLAFVTQLLPTNPFNVPLGPPPPHGPWGVPQDNDLFHISLTVAGDPSDLVQIKISFDIDDGSFTRNTLYYPVSESMLQQVMNNSQSQFTTTTLLATNNTVYQAIYDALRKHGYNPASVLNPTAAISINPSTGQVQIIGRDGRLITLNVPFVTGVRQYTELTVTLSSLSRTGNNMTRTLADTTAVQIAVITKAFASGVQMVVGFGSMWIGGGAQPDTGANGGPYYYRTIGRSSLTGAKSNPTPGTRYGVMPRVQPVWVELPQPYDDQIDTWDIFRYGGTITSWHYIGSAHVTDRWFRDNIFDSQASAGDPLEFDNFEPWPSIELPFHSETTGISRVDVVGTLMNVFGPSTAFPPTIARWLAGTLITLNQNTVYTLWNRPVPILGGWQFRFIETAGAQSNPSIFIAEPIVANQHLPYLWGPDAAGIMYACGDPLRPGTFQGSKPNAPDATPDTAYDLVAPSEPLLGGQIIDGLSLVASSKRWWQLQPALSSAQQWNPIETPAGRGLAAPYGHATDGRLIYFWAKDGIYAMQPGLPAQSLTDADLGNLFPQAETGITIGFDVMYAGFKIFAPDYRFAAWFRLSVMNSMLRAHYWDRHGHVRTLVLDMTPDSAGSPRMAWSVDDYHDPVMVSYQPVQPPAAVQTIGSTSYPENYFGDQNGRVWQETDIHNDGHHPIPVALATSEFDGGDERVRKEWLDAMVDILSPSRGGTLQPVANGEVIPDVVGEIPVEHKRTQHIIPITKEEGEPAHDEPELQPTDLGLLFHWTDDFREIHHPTVLYKWTQEWINQPVEIKTWESNHVTCGLDGYWFIYRLRIAYETAGDDPVLLRIEAYDGMSPDEIELPGTRGEYRKTEFVPSANKGLLFQFTATSENRFALIEEACEIVACQWGRTGCCIKCNGLGGNANP